MKMVWLLLVVVALAITTYRGIGKKPLKPLIQRKKVQKEKPRRLITHHIGMFRNYDPPWVDHSRWMKPEKPEGK